MLLWYLLVFVCASLSYTQTTMEPCIGLFCTKPKHKKGHIFRIGHRIRTRPVSRNYRRFKSIGRCVNLPPSENSFNVPYNFDEAGPILAGTIVRYKCAEGYRHISGRKTYKCNKRGLWKLHRSDLRCQAEVNCRREVFPYGLVDPWFITTFSPGERAQLTCLPHYRLVGNSTRICNATGDWTGEQPRCEISYNESVNVEATYSTIVIPVDCGPPSDHRWSYTLPHGTTTYESTAIIRCVTEPEKQHVISCGTNGQWHPNISCPSNCSRAGDKGSTVNKDAEWPLFTSHGVKGPVKCTNGESLSIQHGSWVPDIRKCFKGIHCSSPTQSGCDVDITGTAVTDTVRFSVHPGQWMFGSPSSTCQLNGLWKPRHPKCYYSCIRPIVNGSATKKDERLFWHGSSTKINCYHGYHMVGPAEIICLDGTWKPYIPTCVETPQTFRYQADSGSHIRVALAMTLKLSLSLCMVLTHLL